MADILSAQVPEARWAGPTDSKWDIYYNDFEGWLNENYDDETQSIAGRHMTWEQACEDEDLLDEYVRMREEDRAEALAEDRYYDERY